MLNIKHKEFRIVKTIGKGELFKPIFEEDSWTGRIQRKFPERRTFEKSYNSEQ